MGNLKGIRTGIPAALAALLVLAGSGCSDRNDGVRSPIGTCADGSNPDFETDPFNCGGCGILCDDLHGASTCQARVCTLTEPTRCDPGFFDLDGNPSNGCECMGTSERDCQICLAYEVPMNGVDDDCNRDTTDLGPHAEGVDARIDIPLTRAHCGAQNASCVLPTGARDVACQLVTCSPSQAARGECGVCEGTAADGALLCGQCIPAFGDPIDDIEGAIPEICFDGIDQDRNGIVDDGPDCEVLLANAATPECHLAAPDAQCPPNVVEIPTAGSPLSELQVGLTYDVLYDRYEVTRAQLAAYLDARGLCAPDVDGWVDPRCEVEGDAGMLPATEVSWCTAFDYCQWAGKRLPTLTEFYRAASADPRGGRGPIDAQGPEQPINETCMGDPAPALPECQAQGLQRVDSAAGVAVVGYPRRLPEDVLRSRSIHHLTGNVAEWLFDAAVDWCAEDGPHALPAFRDITCPAVDASVQRRLLLDFAPSPVDWHDGEPVLREGQQRMMCGGGWASAPGTDRYDHQQRMAPAVRSDHQGFRCARTFHPEPAMADAWPYDRTQPVGALALCERLPPAGGSIRTTTSARIFEAVDACLPAFDRSVSSHLAQRLVMSPLAVLLEVDGHGDDVTRARLQTGVNGGGEQMWLSEVAPIVAIPRVPRACNDATCLTFVVQSSESADDRSPGLVLPEPFGAVARQRMMPVSTLTVGERSPCLEAPGTPARVELEVDRARLGELLGTPGAIPQAVVDRLADDCVDVDDDGQCIRWQVSLDLAFVELPYSL